MNLILRWWGKNKDKGWEDNCQICEKLVRDGDPEITVDYDIQALPPFRFRLVWHDKCLDEKETSN